MLFRSGFGIYERNNRDTDIRYIPELKDTPIHKVVWDGDNLWGATTARHECSGYPPSRGLVRYNWQDKKLETYISKEKGPCGFVIHDLIIAHGYLWVATDVGVSQLNMKEDLWTHYLPELESWYNMTVTSCPATYNKVLKKLPKDVLFPGDRISWYEKYSNYIEEYRPDLSINIKFKK